jgi:glycosyltransferase involved in cell wall biosynthesis
MYVSVIIPHYNDLEALDVCLSALARQSFPAERTEIIVADNASPQGREAVERVVGNRARLITVEQRGAGPARNGGVRASTGEVLAFGLPCGAGMAGARN